MPVLSIYYQQSPHNDIYHLLYIHGQTDRSTPTTRHSALITNENTNRPYIIPPISTINDYEQKDTPRDLPPTYPANILMAKWHSKGKVCITHGLKSLSTFETKQPTRNSPTTFTTMFCVSSIQITVI